ncbi:AVAST type 5 anti-phage protein Avs5 [Paraburkholderia ferrariae]|uniref:AVAST type 5 anti-phage protein Avs5 n=1 Tax=Paraburkholderia ferrariae TaxID=386056 RepID=UPI0004812743|nr:AVAST type 5 anti-phage protein Avs5 [Paraburkholderia ferrariae]
MQEIHFTDPIAATNIATLFKGSRLIPFLGAGFTKGFRAKNGKVPDANALTKIITDVASEKSGLSANDIDQIKEIKDLKTAFELLADPEYISANQAQALLGSLFSKVDIADNSKKTFLKLDWPHIFSFNIDDAIEGSTNRYRILVPNREVSREFINSNACLFKIHGDIEEFLAYKDPNLVFTWRDYAHSIEKNKAMLTFLENQARHSALMFLGCSLDTEVDLLHLSHLTNFSGSIYLKRGKLSIKEKLVLKTYGIEQVIFFDTYDQICPWINETLKGIVRENPFQDISIDDAVVKNSDAITLIANGGPLLVTESNGHRVARKPKNFANRTALAAALAQLRTHECLLVTGRRFSGKSIFLYQLMDSLKQYGSNYYASTDIYYPGVRRLVAGSENTVFFFDSNYLNSQSLEEILTAQLPSTSRLIMCASGGDAEIFRFKLEGKNVKFSEIKLPSVLDDDETAELNAGLTAQGLPNYIKPETLLSFAFRYYNEFKTKLKRSEIFYKNIDGAFLSVLVLIAAFGKAEGAQMECLHGYFDSTAFVSQNEKIFEKECASGSTDYVITCNSSAWLITTLGKYIAREKESVVRVSRIIKALSKDGFHVAARNLISFDKLNELGGTNNVDSFIRGVYVEIQDTYSHEQHYWLQRAKCELISGRSLEDFESGMRYASKVRLDCGEERNQTYFSATLVMAQLCVRSYKFSTDKIYLLHMLDYFLESAKNYHNNKRHMDKAIAPYFSHHSDLHAALIALFNGSGLEFLARRNDIDELRSFLELHRHR